MRLTTEQVKNMIREELEEIYRSNDAPWLPQKMMELGWKPKHTLAEGLRKTYDWFIENTDLQTK